MLNNELLLSGRSKFSISTNVSSGGSVSVSPQGKQYAGTLITVTCSPSSAYQFSSISIVKQDGTTVSYTTVTSGSRYTFIMPSSNVTVNVNYSLIPTYSISLSASGGSVRANKTSGIRAGETITLTMTPNAYYKYQSLSVKTSSGSNVTLNSNNGSTATFTMPSSNVNVNATFVSTAWQFTVGSRYEEAGQFSTTSIGYSENSFGNISPNTFNGHKIQSLFCSFGISDPNSYTLGLRIYGDLSSKSSIKVTRLDSNRSTTLNFVWVDSSNVSVFSIAVTNFFTTGDIGRVIYINLE